MQTAQVFFHILESKVESHWSLSCHHGLDFGHGRTTIYTINTGVQQEPGTNTSTWSSTEDAESLYYNTGCDTFVRVFHAELDVDFYWSSSLQPKRVHARTYTEVDYEYCKRYAAAVSSQQSAVQLLLWARATSMYVQQ